MGGSFNSNGASKDFNKNEDKPNWSLLPQEDGPLPQVPTNKIPVPSRFQWQFGLQEASQLLKVEKCNLISPEELENESA